MTAESGRTSYLLLLVGLLGLFVWNTQGQSCTSQAECEPNVVCQLITWFCNGSSSIATTAAPTPDPLSQPCCQHLDSCSDETIVAGWVAVRNTSIKIDNVDYSIEWLDTFITEGNATLPAVIKSAYVGSWSTLRNVAKEFPSQMFVAEPTNSCTVDGEPKWPEWYQVTVNIMADNNMDSTLEIEERREKQCLCDIAWDCVKSVCEVKTENITDSEADFGQVDAGLGNNVALYCVENLTAINYTASSYFAVGFEPKNAELDTWNLNISVEGGWAPELDDDDMWIKIHLPHDMMVSGLITQGVGLNAERRVDRFKLEYEVSDGSSGMIASSKIFNAGARLDTKLTNYFPEPVKANAIKIKVTEPCDPYYVGLRVQLVGCPWCTADNECTTDSDGVCLPTKNFCTYEEVTTTTEMPTTTAVPSTTQSTTAKQTTAQPTGQISTNNSPNSAALTTTAEVTTTSVTTKQTTADPTMSVPTTEANTVGKTSAAATDITSATTSNAGSTAANADTTINAGASTTKVTQGPTDSIDTTKQTTKAATIPSTLTAEVTTTDKAAITTSGSVTNPVATTNPAEEIIRQIDYKIDEVTASLDVKVEKAVTALILPTNISDGVSTANVNITKDVIEAGLEVIRNITTVANTTQDEGLQRKILEGSWNFMIAVSQNDDSFISESNDLDEVLLQETVAGPLGLVSSIEDVAIKVGKSLIKKENASDVQISRDNLNGVIAVRKVNEVKTDGFSKTFDDRDDSSEEETQVTIDAGQFEENGAIKGLPDNSSLVVVVLKFKSIEALLLTDDVQDQTPGNKRLASSVLSIQVVADGEPQSVPLSFKLGHSKAKEREESKCNFWKPVASSDGGSSKTAGNWSSAGCLKNPKKSGDEYTVCECGHMTNFGVLMWLGDPEEIKEGGAIETISKVGCYVSIAALAVALGLLAYLKSSLSSERIIIHIHLMSVTLVALTIFVLGVNATENLLLCKFITIALHFFFMSMFSWMLVEGIHLYRQVISVFDSEKSRMWVYFAIGWGIPVVVVVIGTAIFISDYGVDTPVCWLNHKDSIWVFMGPIIPTIAVNLVVLIMVSRIVMSASKLQKEKPAFNSVNEGCPCFCQPLVGGETRGFDIAKERAGLRSSLLLLPIMGVTWLFGYFQAESDFFNYAFVTLNSFQGFFMALFHCFMSTEVNNALKQKIRRVKDSSMGGASTMDSQSHKPAMFTSGIRKVKVSPSQTDDTDGF